VARGMRPDVQGSNALQREVQVLLTFDVEVWCDSWGTLDASFPRAFARYVYGESRRGCFALPKTLEILKRHGLKGVFFVEPLFAARFGLQYLKTILSLIQEAGQEVQLHLHQEWADEISPPPLASITRKRPYLSDCTLEEQIELVRLGCELMQCAGAPRPVAFRAGGFAANADTFAALRASAIRCDFSIDCTVPWSVADLRDRRALLSPQFIDDVVTFPMAVFRDGFGRARHVQVGACAAAEMIQAMEGAARLGWTHFVVLSHNFEMLKPGSTSPDRIVVDRFERICDYLGRQRSRLATVNVSELAIDAIGQPNGMPRVSRAATLRRYAEQAVRRLS
jgi:peptidoglycan/xylan/chitin deacetylase (PgdA/CDA1 family)